MDCLYPHQAINNTTGTKGILKLHEKRTNKVKDAVFTYLQNNNVEMISDDQIYYKGKNYPISLFAEILKNSLESENKQNKSFPIITAEDYVLVLKLLNAEQHAALETPSTSPYSPNLSEAQILALAQTEKLSFSKSLEQAQEFLTHILFRGADASGAIKVVVKRKYYPVGLDGQTYTIEKEIMLPGVKSLREYEETLKQHFVKSTVHDKPQTYWDVFSRSQAVVQASSVYNPHKDLYWCDEYKHYYVNDYIEPQWKKQPDYFHMLERNKYDPISSLSKLSNVLRTFLTHLFPDPQVRYEVLKWCAFSNTDKLQTYLTLIGPQGIGKGILVETFLAYYHGEDNFNKPGKIETQYNEKNAKSTLLYFDELTMTNLLVYNEMKRLINPTLSYEQKNKPIYMSNNFANIVWSCNTRDTMSGLSRDDRRFKIVPVTQDVLEGAPILDNDGKKIGTFTPSVLTAFTKNERIKKEFVLLMLAIRDHVDASGDNKDDINRISDNETRDRIYIESRNIKFIEIIDVIKTIHNDFNEVTGRFNKSVSLEEKEALGEEYKDYIPLSKVVIATDTYYTYRVPFGVIRKVIETKGGKDPISFRAFNSNLEKMPANYLKGVSCGGQGRDIEIKLDAEQHTQFKEVLEPIILNYKTKKGLILDKLNTENNKSTPFGD